MRGKIVDTLTRWLAVLGGIAYVPSVWLALRSELWAVAVTDTVVYALIIGMHLGRERLPRLPRALTLLALFYGLGVFLIHVLGPFGAGPLWLFSVTVIAGVLFGSRGGWLALAAVVPTLAVVGARLESNTLVWAIVAANFVFLSLVTSLSIAKILRDLENAEASLRQTQKIEALGLLAGGIAHDLNNLLQPILMYGRLVQRTLPPNHEAQADVAVILSSVDRAGELVKRILAFARKSDARPKPTHVGDIVDETVKLLGKSVQGNVRVTVEKTSSDTVLAEPTELQQVLLNLCTNALHAMRERGGTLAIRLSASGKQLLVSVKDEGSGMDEATAKRCFEPFFTTKQGEGTGLGLAMVQRIVNDLGGAVTLQSRVGVGTTIEIALPLL